MSNGCVVANGFAGAKAGWPVGCGVLRCAGTGFAGMCSGATVSMELRRPLDVGPEAFEGLDDDPRSATFALISSARACRFRKS